MLKNRLIHWVVLISFIIGACGAPTAITTSVAPLPSLAAPTPTPLFSNPAPEQTGSKSHVISYAGANDWLVDLPVEDRQDQIRDWAVDGLIGLLHLDARTISSIAFDQTPVRDGFFFGLANMPIGPGRGFFDGQ